METPPRAVKAIGADSSLTLQIGLLIMAGGGLFGAGAWANSISNRLDTMAGRADRMDVRLEKIESVLVDMRLSRTPPGP